MEKSFEQLCYPNFTLRAYQRTVAELKLRWRIVRVKEAFAEPAGSGTLILRHDIDISPVLALRMAEIEHTLGVRATYFVALHLAYNPHQPRNAAALRAIANMGHEIGFHYDSAVYHQDAPVANNGLAALDRHIEILQELCGRRVVSIARHNPSLSGEGDPFKAALKYHNAYDEGLFHETLYISDSCGAWRDGGLGPCWREPRPPRIYLLIHAEQWANRTHDDRMARFEIMRARAMNEHEAFFNEVQRVWRNHSGGKEHDQRSRLRRGERCLLNARS